MGSMGVGRRLQEEVVVGCIKLSVAVEQISPKLSGLKQRTFIISVSMRSLALLSRERASRQWGCGLTRSLVWGGGFPPELTLRAVGRLQVPAGQQLTNQLAFEEAKGRAHPGHKPPNLTRDLPSLLLYSTSWIQVTKSARTQGERMTRESLPGGGVSEAAHHWLPSPDPLCL